MEKITEDHWKSMKNRAYVMAFSGFGLAALSLFFVVAIGYAGGLPLMSAMFGFVVLIGGMMMGYGLLPKPLREAHKDSTGKVW
jgi:hypothetical protein